MTKLARICARPGCPNVNCAVHVRPPWRTSAGRSAASRGYDAEHRRLRRVTLAEHPICQGCGREPSVIADHITPRSQGGQNVRANYQALGQRCSDAKTARESQAGRKP